jgi:hypothetical protein
MDKLLSYCFGLSTPERRRANVFVVQIAARAADAIDMIQFNLAREIASDPQIARLGVTVGYVGAFDRREYPGGAPNLFYELGEALRYVLFLKNNAALAAPKNQL